VHCKKIGSAGISAGICKKLKDPIIFTSFDNLLTYKILSFEISFITLLSQHSEKYKNVKDFAF
jgi:hypothetical protein